VIGQAGKKAAQLGLRVIFSVLLLAAVAWIVDAGALARRLTSVDFRWFACALALGIVANLISAWRWTQIVRHLRLQATWRPLLLAYCRGVTINTVLPGATLGGDAYRALFVQRLGNPMLLAATSVLLDRLTGLWALFALSCLAWLALAAGDHGGLSLTQVILHAVGAGAIVAGPFVVRALRGIWHTGLPRMLAHVVGLLAGTADTAQATYVSSAFVQIASIASLWSALQAVGVVTELAFLVAVAAPVFLAASLPVSVGGYGTREATLAAYFSLAGLPVEGAVAGALLHGMSATLQGIVWAPLFLIKSHDAAP
jgi:uncharacterized membrane protein YbhN (UPF0104 family)